MQGCKELIWFKGLQILKGECFAFLFIPFPIPGYMDPQTLTPLLHHGLLCKVNLSPLDAGSSQQCHSTSSGKQSSAWPQTRDTNSVKRLFSLLFSQKGEWKDVRSQIPSQRQPCILCAVLTHLGYSVLRCHDTALGLSTRSWSVQSKHGSHCMRTACWCCKLLSAALSERKAVCLFSHLWCTLTPWLKFYIHLHSPNTFLLTQAKHPPPWIKDVS